MRTIDELKKELADLRPINFGALSGKVQDDIRLKENVLRGELIVLLETSGGDNSELLEKIDTLETTINDLNVDIDNLRNELETCLAG